MRRQDKNILMILMLIITALGMMLFIPELASIFGKLLETDDLSDTPAPGNRELLSQSASDIAQLVSNDKSPTLADTFAAPINADQDEPTERRNMIDLKDAIQVLFSPPHDGSTLGMLLYNPKGNSDLKNGPLCFQMQDIRRNALIAEPLSVESEEMLFGNMGIEKLPAPNQYLAWYASTLANNSYGVFGQKVEQKTQPDGTIVLNPLGARKTFSFSTTNFYLPGATATFHNGYLIVALPDLDSGSMFIGLFDTSKDNMPLFRIFNTPWQYDATPEVLQFAHDTLMAKIKLEKTAICFDRKGKSTRSNTVLPDADLSTNGWRAYPTSYGFELIRSTPSKQIEGNHDFWRTHLAADTCEKTSNAADLENVPTRYQVGSALLFFDAVPNVDGAPIYWYGNGVDSTVVNAPAPFVYLPYQDGISHDTRYRPFSLYSILKNPQASTVRLHPFGKEAYAYYRDQAGYPHTTFIGILVPTSAKPLSVSEAGESVSANAFPFYNSVLTTTGTPAYIRGTGTCSFIQDGKPQSVVTYAALNAGKISLVGKQGCEFSISGGYTETTFGPLLKVNTLFIPPPIQPEKTNDNTVAIWFLASGMLVGGAALGYYAKKRRLQGTAAERLALLSGQPSRTNTGSTSEELTASASVEIELDEYPEHANIIEAAETSAITEPVVVEQHHDGAFVVELSTEQSFIFDSSSSSESDQESLVAFEMIEPGRATPKLQLVSSAYRKKRNADIKQSLEKIAKLLTTMEEFQSRSIKIASLFSAFLENYDPYDDMHLLKTLNHVLQEIINEDKQISGFDSDSDEKGTPPSIPPHHRSSSEDEFMSEESSVNSSSPGGSPIARKAMKKEQSPDSLQEMTLHATLRQLFRKITTEEATVLQNAITQKRALHTLSTGVSYPALIPAQRKYIFAFDNNRGLFRCAITSVPENKEMLLQLRIKAREMIAKLTTQFSAADVWYNVNRDTDLENIRLQLFRWHYILSHAQDNLFNKTSDFFQLLQSKTPPPFFDNTSAELLTLASKPALLPAERQTTQLEIPGAEQVICGTHLQLLEEKTAQRRLLSKVQKELEEMQQILLQKEALWDSIATLSHDTLSDEERSKAIDILSKIPTSDLSLLTEKEISSICGGRPIFKDNALSFKSKKSIHDTEIQQKKLLDIIESLSQSSNPTKNTRAKRLRGHQEHILRLLQQFSNPNLHPRLRRTILPRLTFIPHDERALLKPNETQVLFNPYLSTEEKTSYLLQLHQKRFDNSLPEKERHRYKTIWERRDTFWDAILTLSNAKLSDGERKAKWMFLSNHFSTPIIHSLCDYHRPSKPVTDEIDQITTRSRKQCFDELMININIRAKELELFISSLEHYNADGKWQPATEEEIRDFYQRCIYEMKNETKPEGRIAWATQLKEKMEELYPELKPKQTEVPASLLSQFFGNPGKKPTSAEIITIISHRPTITA